jgi:thiol-disulfide isomerase/thioredoxin
MPKAKAAAQSLNIQSKAMVKSLDKVLANGCGTVLVILASWCGACKRAMPMWLKQLKKKNEKNLVLLDNELLPNTSLSSLNITHFPSTFEIPAGGKPTLLENPQDLESMDTLVNSNSPSATSAPPPTVISASEFISKNNSPKSFESLSTKESEQESFPNTLSNFITPKGFTPSMGTVKRGGRSRRRARKITRRTRTRS